MKRLIVFGFIVAVFLLLSMVHPVQATISSCTASATPASMNGGQSNSVTINVTNGGSQSATWIEIISPGGDFSMTGVAASGWTNSVGAIASFLTGGTLGTSQSVSIVLDVFAANASTNGTWSVNLSDDGGSTKTACTGSLTGSITAEAVDTAPSISDIVISDIVDSSVKISWTTDEDSTSVVDYGTTDAYGSTKSDGSSVTSHSFTITGLTANTTYHFNAKSTDATGNVGESGDNIFTTAKAGVSTSTSTTGTVRVVTATPKPTIPPDRTPPKIVLDTSLSEPFLQAPLLRGKVTDPSHVTDVQISIDGGKSFAPADTITPAGGTNVEFTYKVLDMLDDNYEIVIKGIDGVGNSGVKKVGVLVIDRLPPSVGAQVVSLGPQVISPNIDGTISVLTNRTYRLSVSTVGGPITMDLQQGKNERVAPMTKQIDSGLWVGDIVMPIQPGMYTFTLHAKDGAGNTTERTLPPFIVQTGGKLIGEDSVVLEGTVTIYTLDPVTKRFVRWEAGGWGETNPQRILKDTSFGWYLPKGTYYVRAESPTHRPTLTSIIVKNRAGYFTPDIHLPRAPVIRLGFLTITLPWVLEAYVPVQDTQSYQDTIETTKQYHALPHVTVYDGARAISTTTFIGKPTILTFLTSWYPQTSAQLSILSEVAGKKEINVAVIFPQESSGSVSVYGKLGGWKVPIYSDPDGKLIDPLEIAGLPYHVFVDRKGTIISKTSGLMTKEQIFDMLIQ